MILRPQKFLLAQRENNDLLQKQDREAECLTKRSPGKRTQQLLEYLLPPDAFDVGTVYLWSDDDEEYKLAPGRIPCIVSKNPNRQCYSRTVLRLEWDSEECNNFLQEGTKKCPAYLSICQKK